MSSFLDEKEQADKPGLIFMTRKVLKYVFSVAWKTKKSIFFMYFLRFLGSALSELKVLLLPKLLIDEIVAIKDGAAVETHIKTIVLYVALTVSAEFLSRLLSNIANSSINYYSTIFERALNERMCEKSMTMDFQYTEDPDVLTQQRKAQEGISWYSGGITGMLGSLYDIIYNIVLMFTSVTIIAFYCPLIIPVQIAAMVVVCIYNLKNQKIELEFYSKLAKSNRLFGYYMFDIPSYKNGMDTRLYNSADMFTERGEQFETEQIAVCAEQNRLQRINRVKGHIANALRDAISYFYMGYRALKKL
ncbi:MAG: hypothetical protein J6Y89_09825, partial [Lachnospiraceae bacterium]|nr:hypothetical protein [Lachnospiraceae bacterium]